jgi:hypothetical protein
MACILVIVAVVANGVAMMHLIEGVQNDDIPIILESSIQI